MHFLILRTKHKLLAKISNQTPPKLAKTSPITPLKKGKKKKKTLGPLDFPSHISTLSIEKHSNFYPNTHEKSKEKPQKNPLKKLEKKS